MQDVQQLTLVLVQTLDLYVKDRAGINFDSVVLKDVVGKTDLILVLDVEEFLPGLLVIRIDSEFFHAGQVGDPLVADVIGNPVCQQRVAVQQETSLGNTVGLVVELLGEHLVEVLQLAVLEDLGVQARNAVDGITGHDCHIGHADHTVIDDAHAADLVVDIDTGVVISLVDLGLKAAVDLLDNAVNTGKELGEEVDGPFLECFRHDGVVGVGCALGGHFPRLVPGQFVLVHEQTHQFRNSQGRMRVVHLEDDLLVELFDIVMGLQILLDHGLQGSRDEEVLLFETEFLTLIILIIGIEDIADGPCQVFLLDGLLIIALIKGIQLEGLNGLRVPDTKSIDKAVAVADNGKVIGNSLDCAVAFLFVHGPAQLLVVIGLDITAEMDFLGVLGSAQFERIAVLKPVVRHFLLVAVLDLLLEHAVVITDAAAVSRIIEGGQGIKEACCETAQTAVAQSRIGLLVLDGVQAKAELFEGLFNGTICHQVDRVVTKCTSHKEFHGQIDKFLGILVVKGLLGAHPAVDDLVLEGQCGGLEHLLFRCFLHGAAVHCTYIVLYASLKKVFVKFDCRSF